MHVRPFPLCVCQMAAVKMGSEPMSHLNSSSAGVEASLYYPGQKRPGEDGGRTWVEGRGVMGHDRTSSVHHGSLCILLYALVLRREGDKKCAFEMKSGCNCIKKIYIRDVSADGHC